MGILFGDNFEEESIYLPTSKRMNIESPDLNLQHNPNRFSQFDNYSDIRDPQTNAHIQTMNNKDNSIDSEKVSSHQTFQNYRNFKEIFSQKNYDSQIAVDTETLMTSSWKSFCTEKGLNPFNFEAYFLDIASCDIQTIKAGEFKKQKLGIFYGRIAHLELQHNNLVYGILENPTGRIEAYFETECFNFAPKNIIFSQGNSQRQSFSSMSKGFSSELRNVTFENSTSAIKNKPPFAIGVILEIEGAGVVSIDSDNQFVLVKSNNVTKHYWTDI